MAKGLGAVTLPFILGGSSSEPTPTAEHSPTLMAAEVYAELAPVASGDEASGFALRALVRAIASMFAQAEEAVRARGDGYDAWERLWNPDLMPTWLLPFIGQGVGVVVDTSLTRAEQIAAIREEGGWKRGRPASVIKAVAATLGGAKGVRLVERNSSPWTALIITRPSETPSAAATKLAGDSQKPGGMIFTYEQSDLPLIDEGSRVIDLATSGTIDTATLAQVT